MVEVGVRVGVTDDHPLGTETLLDQDVELGSADGRCHAVGRDGHAGRDRGPRRGAMDPLLGRAEPGLVGADLADDPGPHAGPGDPVLELGDELGRQLAHRPAGDARLRWVVGLAIPAAAHHDVEPGSAGEAAQPLRIAADARQGEVDERGAAAAPEVPQLVGDEVVGRAEGPVVPARRDLPQADAGVLVWKGHPHLVRRDRSAHGHDAFGHRGSSWSVAPAGMQAGRRRIGVRARAVWTAGSDPVR